MTEPTVTVRVSTLKALMQGMNDLLAVQTRLATLLDETLLAAGHDTYPPTARPLPENVTRLSDRRPRRAASR